MLEGVRGAYIDAQAAKRAQHIIDLEIREDALAIHCTFLSDKGHAARRASLDASIAGDAEMIIGLFTRDKCDRPFEALHGDALFGIDHGDGLFEKILQGDPHPREEAYGSANNIAKIFYHLK